MRTLLAVLLCGSSIAGTAFANEQALYDPTPPADSAFVRVINAGGKTVDPELGGIAFGKVKDGGVSAYQVVKGGTPQWTAGNDKKDITVEAGKYYTIAVTQTGTETLSDAPVDKPTKAYIYFYNLSDAPSASLHAVKQNADVVKDIMPNREGFREVTAIPVDLAVNADGKTVRTFENVALKRRAGVTFLLTGSKDARKVTMTENQIKR